VRWLYLVAAVLLSLMALGYAFRAGGALASDLRTEALLLAAAVLPAAGVGLLAALLAGLSWPSLREEYATGPDGDDDLPGDDGDDDGGDVGGDVLPGGAR